MRPCKLWHLFDIYVMQAFTIVQQCTEYRFYIEQNPFCNLKATRLYCLITLLKVSRKLSWRDGVKNTVELVIWRL